MSSASNYYRIKGLMMATLMTPENVSKLLDDLADARVLLTEVLAADDAATAQLGPMADALDMPDSVVKSLTGRIRAFLKGAP